MPAGQVPPVLPCGAGERGGRRDGVRRGRPQGHVRFWGNGRKFHRQNVTTDGNRGIINRLVVFLNLCPAGK